jgi:hypothetical protein
MPGMAYGRNSLLPQDGTAAYQLVGEVMAHQGYNRYGL